jgi:hypothetical protein
MPTIEYSSLQLSERCVNRLMLGRRETLVAAFMSKHHALSAAAAAADSVSAAAASGYPRLLVVI